MAVRNQSHAQVVIVSRARCSPFPCRYLARFALSRLCVFPCLYGSAALRLPTKVKHITSFPLMRPPLLASSGTSPAEQPFCSWLRVPLTACPIIADIPAHLPTLLVAPECRLAVGRTALPGAVGVLPPRLVALGSGAWTAKPEHFYHPSPLPSGAQPSAIAAPSRHT